MPRTTLNIDSTVLAELRARGQREGRSLGEVASELLAESLHGKPAEQPEFTWSSKPMGAKVDLEDDEAVSEALERE